MQINNILNNEVGLGYDNNSDTVGIVMKTVEDMGYPGLGVFIPKFMLGYTFKKNEVGKEETVSIQNDKCVNDSSIGKIVDSSAVIKNYISVRPLLNQNQFIPEYVIGDKIIVKIIDNDLKTLMFYPFSINRLGQRATDKLIMCVPANKKENTALSEDNTYFIKFDSTNQEVEISANNVNGETCKQTILLNPKDGLINITDNGKLIWTMDTKNDTISSQTSGSSIEQAGDVVTIKADTINIQAESEVNVKSDTYNNEAETVKCSGSDVTFEYDNFKQSGDSGEWEVRDEKHSNTSVSFVDASTFFVDIPTIGLNGKVELQNFVIGNISNINSPVMPLNGDSGSAGSMLLKTSASGMPLVKAAPLITILTTLAAGTAMYPSDGGAASSMVASIASQLMTNKILGE